MKLTGIFVAATLAAGVFTQSTNSSFDLSALNGTWHLAGLADALFMQISLFSKIYNLTLSCPQVYITGNSSNTSYIQPSLTLGWYNKSSEQSQSANFSLSGLITYNATGSNATFGKFHGLFALPFAGNGKNNKNTSPALTSGNASNPLPNGPDFEADLNITLTSSFNNGTNNVIFFSGNNFTSNTKYGFGSGGGKNQVKASAFGYSDMVKVLASGGGNGNNNDLVFTGIFVNTSNTLPVQNFTTVTTNLGIPTANLTLLNDTCTSASV